jgi:hypothetical protein
MRIALEQLVCPEFAEEVTCSMCERPFVLGLVIARALTGEKTDAGEVCPECALWLADGPMAAARPEGFPGLAAFKEHLELWEVPEFPSAEEAYAFFDALE